MKNSLLLILLILCSKNVPGQTFNYSHHSGSETTFNMIGINSKSFYLEKSTAIGSCCNDSIRLVGLYSIGIRMFRVPVVNGPEMRYGTVMKTFDQHLITVCGTWIYGCDFGDERFYVSKLDTAGNKLWSLTINSRIEFLIPLPDGSFYLHDGDNLKLYSASGQTLSSDFQSISGVQSATGLQSGKILISYINYTTNAAWFRILDTNGVPATNIPSQVGLTSLTETGNYNILGISGNAIQKYDSSLVFVNSTANTTQGSNIITAFVLRNDTIFATGQNGISSQPVYYMFDSDLNLLHQSSSNIEKIHCTGICIGKNNRVNIISWGNSGIAGNSFTGFFQTFITGNLNAKHDIGIIQQELADDPVYKVISPIEFRGLVNLVVTVKNFGTDTVNGFRVNSYATYSNYGPCLTGLNKFYTAVLPPGGTVTVNTGSFYTRTFSYSQLNSDKSLDLNLCLNTTAPGSMNDIDVTNDYECTFMKLLPVGLIENSELDNKIRIYPNPSSSGITVQAHMIINTIEIYDVSGKMLKKIEVNKNEFYVENRSLPNGLYIFKINTDKGMVTKKIAIDY